MHVSACAIVPDSVYVICALFLFMCACACVCLFVCVFVHALVCMSVRMHSQRVSFASVGVCVFWGILTLVCMSVCVRFICVCMYVRMSCMYISMDLCMHAVFCVCALAVCLSVFVTYASKFRQA